MGCSISSDFSVRASLSSFLFNNKTKKNYLMSSGFQLSRTSLLIDMPVYQPSLLDGALIYSDKIASVTDLFSSVQFKICDVAVAELVEGIDFTNNLNLSSINGAFYIGMFVQMMGAGSGYASGVVQDINLDYAIMLPTGERVVLKDQFLISIKFVNGDLGAPVYMNGVLLGFVTWFTNDGYCIVAKASNIERIISTYGYNLYY
jgi:hypothetical protein